MRGGWIFFFKMNKRDSTFIREMRVLFSLLNVEVYPEKRLDSRKCAKAGKLSATIYVNEFRFPFKIFSTLKVCLA